MSRQESSLPPRTNNPTNLTSFSSFFHSFTICQDFCCMQPGRCGKFKPQHGRISPPSLLDSLSFLPVSAFADEGSHMDTVHDDRFMVYVRMDPDHLESPENVERPLASCSSYEEARRIQRECHHTFRECVIRY